jgi:hypothetical protein
MLIANHQRGGLDAGWMKQHWLLLPPALPCFHSVLEYFRNLTTTTTTTTSIKKQRLRVVAD